MILNLTILGLSLLKDIKISASIEKIGTTFLYTLGLHNPVGSTRLLSSKRKESVRISDFVAASPNYNEQVCD